MIFSRETVSNLQIKKGGWASSSIEEEVGKVGVAEVFPVGTPFEEIVEYLNRAVKK